MIFAVRAVGLLLGFTVFSSTSYAHTSPCEALLQNQNARAITLKALKEASAKVAAQKETKVPKPDFDNIEVQAKIEQVGEIGPLAFQQMLPKGISFISTPAPTASDAIAVDLYEEGRSVALHVDTMWKGKRSSTAAFVSLPRPKIINNSPYLVSTEYPVVLVHLHGGGTPTATGRNGMSIAKEVGKRGIPVIAFDLPGHGRATRDPRNLETMHLQAEWVLQIIEQLVDPKVKVVLSGHSWGGAFAVFMRRLKLDPRYADRISRISHFIPMAPPVDVSLSGNNRERMAFENEYRKNFDQYEKDIASADFKFEKNIVSSGKISDIGGYFCTLTDMDFATKPLTPAEEVLLAPEDIFIGSADSLYVGREKYYQKAFASSKLHVMGPGRTWQSKGEQDLRSTGHNLFDRYIDGTTTPEMYRLIGDIVVKYAGGTELNLSESSGDKALDLVDRMFRHYGNFFGFREMLNNAEYVTTDASDRSGYSKRKGFVQEYVDRMEPLDAEMARLKDPQSQIPQVQKAIEELRNQIGLDKQVTLKRAQEDLVLPALTADRRKDLQEYITQVKSIESDLKSTYKDSEYEAEIQNLNEQFKKLIVHLKISSVSEYESSFKAYQGRKSADPSEAWVRSDLSRLHQKVIEVTGRKMRRFGVSRDARVSALRAPEGVRDLRSAQRELDVDRSPEHQTKLRKFIAEYEKTDSATRAGLISQLQQRMAREHKPEGILSLDQARAQRDELDARLNFTYAPKNQPEIAMFASQIKQLQQEVDVLSKGNGETSSMEKIEISVKDLRTKRASLLKKWDGFWNAGVLTSPNVERAEQNMNQTLENYKELYAAYDGQKQDWLLKLRESGRLTGDNILKATPSLLSLRTKVQNAKDVYLRSRQEFETLRWNEAIKGRLQGPEEMTRKVTAVAREIWGDNYSKTGKAGVNSVTQTLRVEEEYLANRQAQLSIKEQQLAEFKAQYAKRMMAIGERVPFNVQKVDLRAPLNQSLEGLVAQLRADPVLFQAYTQVVSRWEGFLGRLRADSQTKDGGGY